MGQGVIPTLFQEDGRATIVAYGAARARGVAQAWTAAEGWTFETVPT